MKKNSRFDRLIFSPQKLYKLNTYTSIPIHGNLFFATYKSLLRYAHYHEQVHIEERTSISGMFLVTTPLCQSSAQDDPGKYQKQNCPNMVDPAKKLSPAKSIFKFSCPFD